jgi:hypothetical protein
VRPSRSAARWLFALVLAFVVPSAAKAEIVSEIRRDYFAYRGTTDFYDGLLLLPRPLLSDSAVDLGALLSKYIGETEVNLDALFEQAENLDVILMFEEADALFGKRTEVEDPEDPTAQDFILLDLDGLRWYGQIHFARLEGIYELAGPYSIPLPMSLALFVPGLIALARCR